MKGSILRRLNKSAISYLVLSADEGDRADFNLAKRSLINKANNFEPKLY